MADDDAPGLGLYGPQGTDGKLYKEEYFTLLHTLYENSGPCSFRRRGFL